MISEHDAANAVWRKSGYLCHPPDLECVEVATIGRRIAVRDSANRDGPKIDFFLKSWRSIISVVKSDQFEPSR
jgi:hypothetical protein